MTSRLSAKEAARRWFASGAGRETLLRVHRRVWSVADEVFDPNYNLGLVSPLFLRKGSTRISFPARGKGTLARNDG